MKVAKGGTSWILSSLGLLLLFSFGYLLNNHQLQIIFIILTILSFLFTILLVIFFRDPNRIIGNGLVAVADGIIRDIDSIEDEDIGSSLFISTFMNIYHVHVNRMPIDGTITNIIHKPGSHLPAFTKESNKNERVIITIKTAEGPVKIVLIAGTIARRIVPYVKKGDTLRKGDKISLIRLGSRVDVYISKKLNVSLKISKKDRVKAGVSSVATSNV